MRSPDSSNLRGDCFGMISIYFAGSDHGNKLFSGDSLKRTVWGGNRSIKTILFVMSITCRGPTPRSRGFFGDLTFILRGVDKFQFAPTLQKPEGFRVKASEGEVVVFYFEPSATQNLKPSGFPDVLGRS